MNSHGCEHCGHSFPSCQCRSDLHGNFQDFGNIQMWQDQHYLGPESGFISGATTTRSSRTGHDHLDNISEGGFLSGMHKPHLMS